jgi:hypothetical protein
MESYADVYTTDTIHIERNLYIKIMLVHRLKINCMRLLFRCKAIDIHLHVLKMLPRSQAVNGHDIAKLKKDKQYNG